MGCGGSVAGKKKPLNEEAEKKVKDLFSKMDQDGSNAITREEAMKFFKSFAKVSANALFDEVDEDKDGTITCQEFMDFWSQVKGAGYTDQDIMDELDNVLEGGSWTNFKDGRDVAINKDPKRKD
eukprot:TRINITY_DN72557_c0_g1_i1.p1 TRINITY_DN72557_c0_g1~~TRINITY_DN72557_c0_g1_i1.p1  ORF type:complete len:124 (+),score=45.48 TRINITY_DN72557_c0_g1_i1:51-422(+)